MDADLCSVDVYGRGCVHRFLTWTYHPYNLPNQKQEQDMSKSIFVTFTILCFVVGLAFGSYVGFYSVDLSSYLHHKANLNPAITYFSVNFFTTLVAYFLMFHVAVLYYRWRLK